MSVLFHRVGAAAIALATLAACGDALTGGRATDARTTVTVGPIDRAALSRPWARGFTLEVTVANAGPAAVFVHACGVTLERRVGGRWEQLAGGFACALPAGGGTEIEAGAQRTFPVPVGPALGGPAIPTADGYILTPLPGPYRVNIVTMGTRERMFPEAARVSAPFEL